MADTSNSPSVAAFTALGTIVGYLGTEAGSASVFNRLLWASRFYNTTSLKSYVGFVFLMPMGGPIHKGAVNALDSLVRAGLWRGNCRGEMLGTPFFNDSKHRYVMTSIDRSLHKMKEETKQGRNAFWISVMELIPWQRIQDTSDRQDDDERQQQLERIRAHRPFFILKLSWPDSPSGTKAINKVKGDLRPLQVRHLVGVMASEMITLVLGIVTAVVWRSLFALWYIFPCLLKVCALCSSVRREHVKPTKKNMTPPSKETKEEPNVDELSIYEVEDKSNGFFLMEGPSELVGQFFRHYGHPLRVRKGLLGDRTRELISMFTIFAFILVYPVGLLVFIFAPWPIQWCWLGYQIYAMIAMHLYRFLGGEHIGTTPEWVARELYEHGKVCVADEQGARVIARLEKATVVSSVANGRQEVKNRKEEVFRDVMHSMEPMTSP